MSDQAPDAITQTPEATPAPTSNAPWAADLAQRFSDPTVQQQVDSYLRETWQPRMTQLEQQVAGLSDAQEYYEDLTTNPGQTWVSLTHEILGDELAERVLAALQDEPATPPADPSTTTDTPQSQLSPEDQAFIDKLREREQMSEYHNAVNAFCDATDNDGNKLRPDLKADWFHPFVAAADGNLHQAYAGYQEWLTDVKAGLAPATQEGAAAAAEAAPTMGSGDGGVATPPVAKDYQGNLDAAIDDVFADMQRAPATVGSI